MADEKDSRTALPPQALLYQMAVGHYLPRALNVAAKLGVADLLRDGPRSAEDLAAAARAHAPALRRMLRFLVSAGVFDEREDGAFALTPLSECLRSDVPASARPMVLLFAGTSNQEAWADLEACVRTGEPVYRRRGFADPFEMMAQRPEEVANFDAAMAHFTSLVAIGVGATWDFSSLTTLVDVGGGNGALLIGILSMHPHLHGIVFDQPEAAGRATRAIAEAGLAERCRSVGGSFFESVPEGGDAYLMKHVLHNWEDGRAGEILRTCRRAMRPDARLLVVEGVYPARVDHSLQSRAAAANDVNMLVNTGGRQRSEEEFRTLFADAGFELTRLLPLPGTGFVIEGLPRQGRRGSPG